MRAVIDTNVLVSGLFWHGAPHALLAQVRTGTLTLISSPALIAELSETISREKFRDILAQTGTDSGRILAEISLLVELVDPPPLLKPVSRDPDDDAVLALAIAARCDLVISGDQDLLVLGDYADIPIVTPAKALAMIGVSPE